MYASTAHLELNAPGAVTIWQPATSYTGSFFSVATCLTAVTTTSAYPACVTNEWNCLFGIHTCAQVLRTPDCLAAVTTSSVQLEHVVGVYEHPLCMSMCASEGSLLS
jgi:hypothetical protein